MANLFIYFLYLGLMVTLGASARKSDLASEAIIDLTDTLGIYI